MAKAADDVKTSGGLWVSTYKCGGVGYETRIHSAWSNMRGRCRPEFKARLKTYEDCSYVTEWEDFQVFADWYSSQTGYNVLCRKGRRYQLDKDILLPGNKLYAPDTCVLIPQGLNTFLLDCGAQRGEYPQGVSLYKHNGKFRAYIRDDGAYIHLGTYATAAEASLAYTESKKRQADRWASLIRKGEVVADPRVIGAIERKFLEKK